MSADRPIYNRRLILKGITVAAAAPLLASCRALTPYKETQTPEARIPSYLRPPDSTPAVIPPTPTKTPSPTPEPYSDARAIQYFIDQEKGITPIDLKDRQELVNTLKELIRPKYQGAIGAYNAADILPAKDNSWAHGTVHFAVSTLVNAAHIMVGYAGFPQNKGVTAAGIDLSGWIDFTKMDEVKNFVTKTPDGKDQIPQDKIADAAVAYFNLPLNQAWQDAAMHNNFRSVIRGLGGPAKEATFNVNGAQLHIYMDSFGQFKILPFEPTNP